MREHDTDDVRPFGGIDVATLQRYLNFHFSVSLDLFGAETSTNGANYFAAGLKGRFQEDQRPDDHRLHGDVRTVPAVAGATIVDPRGPGARRAERDAARRLRGRLPEGRRPLEPHAGRGRSGAAPAPRRLQPVGRRVRAAHVTPDGRVVDAAEWDARRSECLPTATDDAFVQSLMAPVREPGRMAGWIAPPAHGIHAKPLDYEYVRS